MKKPNKAFHRTPHTVAFFAKTRKKSRQYAPPVNAALGAKTMSKHRGNHERIRPF
jgi:hypothetical protein